MGGGRHDASRYWPWRTEDYSPHLTARVECLTVRDDTLAIE